MADLEGFLARCDTLSRETARLAKQGKRMLVVTHIDADGLTSGSIIFAHLARMGADVAVRSVPDLDPARVKQLADAKYDFYIFTDLASGLVTDLEAALDARFLVIDHHQLPEADMEKPAVLNVWRYGYDGGREACSSTAAYLFSSAAGTANRDLSYLAVVGAVADRQDVGQGRSLTELNRRAAEDARVAGLLSVESDLMLTGRETRPVHEALALTSSPYLPGITGNKDAALAALLQAGMKLKNGARWRTASELSQEEKMKLTEVVAGIIGSSSGATAAITGMVGEVYSFPYEDAFTPLRDAREFATLLNACGRMGAPGLGMSICLGDRGGALKEAMKTLAEYRLGISRAIQAVTAERSRIEEHGDLVLVRAERLVDERLLGPVTSIITSSPEFKGKVVVAMTNSGESELKVSSRVGDAYPGEVNLGVVMREAAQAAEGVGGGHTMAAGAKIPSSMADAFSRAVLERIK